MATLNDLKATYPELLPAKGYACDMPNGWLDLFGQLCHDIDAAAAKHGVKPGDRGYPVIVQYKEKFGALRVYFDCTHEGVGSDVRTLVEAACSKSVSTCSGCGAPGQSMRNDGFYVRNFCDQCERVHQSGRR